MQKRTGSVFGVQCRFYKTQLVRSDGEYETFLRTGDGGSDITHRFCPKCGSTLFWEISSIPEIYGVAAGGFSDPKYIPVPVFSVYEARKHSWVELPPDIEHMD
jgi:hypothetical protein